MSKNEGGAIKSYLDVSLLTLLEIFVCLLVGLCLQGAEMEVAILHFLGLSQRLFGLPSNICLVGVLVHKLCHHFPSLLGIKKYTKKHEFWMNLLLFHSYYVY